MGWAASLYCTDPVLTGVVTLSTKIQWINDRLCLPLLWMKSPSQSCLGNLKHEQSIWNCNNLSPQNSHLSKTNRFARGTTYRLSCLSVILFLYFTDFTCMYISAPHMCLVPAETRRRHWIAWNWSYRWFWATAWELGIEPGASERVSSTHNYWASLQPQSACKFKSTDLLFCSSWGGSTSHPVPFISPQQASLYTLLMGIEFTPNW